MLMRTERILSIVAGVLALAGGIVTGYLLRGWWESEDAFRLRRRTAEKLEDSAQPVKG
jgi:hypothetical protein